MNVLLVAQERSPADWITAYLALTAHAMSGGRDRALLIGCDGYHTEPIDFSRLLEKIQAWLPTINA